MPELRCRVVGLNEPRRRLTLPIIRKLRDALARIAASYDPKLKSAPLTRGHKPTSGEAALGWVAALAFSDGKLHADIDQLDALFAGAVTRRIKGRL